MDLRRLARYECLIAIVLIVAGAAGCGGEREGTVDSRLEESMACASFWRAAAAPENAGKHLSIVLPSGQSLSTEGTPSESDFLVWSRTLAALRNVETGQSRLPVLAASVLTEHVDGSLALRVQWLSDGLEVRKVRLTVHGEAEPLQQVVLPLENGDMDNSRLALATGYIHYTVKEIGLAAQERSSLLRSCAESACCVQILGGDGQVLSALRVALPTGAGQRENGSAE